jgi:hypothetical protein
MKLRRRMAFLKASDCADKALQLQQGFAPGGIWSRGPVCTAATLKPAHVRFVPKADIGPSFDHFVGGALE